MPCHGRCSGEPPLVPVPALKKSGVLLGTTPSAGFRPMRGRRMTERMYDTPSATGSAGSTSDVAKDQARAVADDAKQSGQQVAATAKDQTREVAGEAKNQAKELYHQVRGEATQQASTQQQRAASGLRSLSDELDSMASQSGSSGMATDLAR